MAATGAGLLATRRLVVDAPGARASHARPTPTGGGAAVMAGVAAGAAAALHALGPTPGVAVAGVVLLLALAFGAMGLADDARGMDARLKLLTGAALALALAAWLPPLAAIPLAPGATVALPAWLAVLGAALWLVTATNAVNFMDGADGFVPGGSVVLFAALACGAALGGATALAVVAAMAAAAYAGFLPWNLAGRLFQGDAGSLFGGVLLAALHLAGAASGALPLLFGPLLLLPWLTDVLLTLLRRARGGRPLLHAHREHLYQRWLQATGRPHLALSWRNAAVCAATAAAALGMAAAPRAWQGPILLAALFACVLGWIWASRRLDRRLAALRLQVPAPQSSAAGGGG